MTWKYLDRALVLDLGEAQIIVHKYVGCGGELFVTSCELGFKRTPLHTSDLETAKVTAIKLARRRCESVLEALKGGE